MKITKKYLQRLESEKRENCSFANAKLKATTVKKLKLKIFYTGQNPLQKKNNIFEDAKIHIKIIFIILFKKKIQVSSSCPLS